MFHIYKNRKAITFNVVGVVRPKQNTEMSGSIGAVGYTSSLIEYITNNASQIRRGKLKIQPINVLTNQPFTGPNVKFEQNLGWQILKKPKEIRIYPSNFCIKRLCN